MEKLKLEKPWEEVKQLILEIVPTLSEEDLVYVVGEENQLIERLSKKMNRNPDETKSWIESVSHTTDRAS